MVTVQETPGWGRRSVTVLLQHSLKLQVVLYRGAPYERVSCELLRETHGGGWWCVVEGAEAPSTKEALRLAEIIAKKYGYDLCPEARKELQVPW